MKRFQDDLKTVPSSSRSKTRKALHIYEHGLIPRPDAIQGRALNPGSPRGGHV